MHPIRSIGVALLLCCVLAPAAMASDATVNERLVRRFVAAFNAQDADAMAALVDDEVEWLSIQGTVIGTETRGREALHKGMRDYFKSCPSCRSRLTQVTRSNSRISAVEVARWVGKDGRREQRSLSVYEFESGRIRRVYYFPVEP